MARRVSLSLTAPVDEPGETTTRGWLYRASQRKGSGLSGLGLGRARPVQWQQHWCELRGSLLLCFPARPRDTSALLKGHNLRRAGRGTTYKCVAAAPVAPRLGLCTQLSH